MPSVAKDRSSQLHGLSQDIREIFGQAQNTSLNHQKNIIALYKLHNKAVGIIEPHRNGVKMLGENEFKKTMFDILNTVLAFKKGVVQADRAVKFLANYFKHMNDRVLTDEDDMDNTSMDTAASRFTDNVVEYLLNNGCGAKDKVVRYRSVLICAEIVFVLGEIDQDIYDRLYTVLLERLTDKETSVRTQAAIALGKFSQTEEDPRLLEILLDGLAYDPSWEVRRAIVMNIPITAASLPAIVDRTKDTEPTVRKLVFSHVLNRDLSANDKVPHHPANLTIAQRESICKNGFGDRESTVRSAAAGLIEVWMRALGDEELDMVTQVTRLLERFDLMENKVANDMLLGVFAELPHIFESISFKETFWGSLTPEKAFMIRVFVEHCDAVNKRDRKEEVLPEVTALAFRIEHVYEQLFILIRDEEAGEVELDDEARVDRQDEKDNYEMILQEMLKLAVRLDYQDEAGRRKMHTLIENLLVKGLTPRHVPVCLDVFRVLSNSEGDLIRRVVGIIEYIRDPPQEEEDEPPIEDDPDASFDQTPGTSGSRTKSREEMTPAEQEHEDEKILVCLTLLEGCLERINGPLSEHALLDAVRNNLIAPCLARKEIAFREKATLCLALMCLIDEEMGVRWINFFYVQIERSETSEDMKLHMLRAVFDILIVYSNRILSSEAEERYISFFTNLLDNERSAKMQAVLGGGLAKFALAGVLVNKMLLQRLVVMYFRPSSANNHALRQCLHYFIPMFCRLNPANQAHINSIFLPTLEELCILHYTKDDDEDMVPMLQIGSMFAEWTDPGIVLADKGDPILQFETALEITRELAKGKLHEEHSKEFRKVLFQVLPKLNLPDAIDERQLVHLKVWVKYLRASRPPRDTVAKTAFKKFEDAFVKKYEEQLRDFDENQYRALEDFNNLFEEVDNLIPEDDEVVEPVERSGRKRRSMSVTSTTTDGEGPSDRTRRGKAKAKKRRVSTSEDEDSYDEDETDRAGSTPPQSSAPTRTMPKRAATRRPAPEPTLDLVTNRIEETDEDDDDAEATPRVSNRTRSSHTTDDDDESQPNLSASTIPNDSIFDDEDEEEEDEVSGLLVED
ncbi:chromosome condensation complex Condensin, subunit G [Marasmius tenuissimus]|nr:chromosome condensation complex Condensin, subunit G [Marasmius tenuissimus]